LALAVAVAVGLIGAVGPTAYADDDRVVFRIRSAEITESSSLVVSTTQDRLAYTTNDSGDDAVVYAVDTRSGRVVGRTTLSGLDAYDIEALGGAADGSLVVADIGDNSGVRERVTFARIDQPKRGDRTVSPDVVSMRYVDGPRDAEAVLYDSESDRVFVVSKEFGGAHVYRSGKDAFTRRFGVLRPIAVAPPLATDATYLPGGDRVVIRGYIEATVFRASGWRPLAQFGMPAQEQGESIAAPPSGDVVWVGSEGVDSPVLAVSLPELPGSGSATTGEPAGGGGGTGSTDPTSGGSSSGSAAGQESAGNEDDQSTIEDARALLAWVAGSALAALVVVLVLLVVKSRHSRHG
jgi:hypothetical protein